MPNGWHIHFDPSLVYITPQAGGTFTTAAFQPGQRIVPPKGAFPVIKSVQLRLTDDAQGPAPITTGNKAPAVLELISALKPLLPASGIQWISVGKINGTVEYNSSTKPKPVPKFTCGTKSISVPGATTKKLALDFTPGSAAEISSSDWALEVNPHPDTFDLSIGTSFQIRLPWVFEQKSPKLLLSARLTVNGTLACDEKVNTPLEIPLEHRSIPDDLITTNPKFTFYGVDAVAPYNIDMPKKIPVGNNKLLVFIHSTLEGFINQNLGASALTQVKTDVNTMLTEVGFSSISVISSADASFKSEQQRFDSFFGRTGGKFHAKNMQNLQSLPANGPTNAKTFLPDRDFVFDGDGARLPFFDFFICLESTDPPQSDELGMGEMYNRKSTIDDKAKRSWSSHRLFFLEVLPVALGFEAFSGKSTRVIKRTSSQICCATKLVILWDYGTRIPAIPLRPTLKTKIPFTTASCFLAR